MARLLLKAFRWFEDGLLAQLEAAGWPGIRRSHSMVFAHLGRGGTRPSDIARRIGVTRQSMHQTIAELEEMGLIELVTDPTNRSAKLVVLTELGKQQSRDALRAFANLERTVAARVGPRAAAALRRALEADWGAPPRRPGP